MMEKPDGGGRFLPNANESSAGGDNSRAARQRRKPLVQTPPTLTKVPPRRSSTGGGNGQERRAQRTRVSVKTKNGGGFNPSVNPSINLTIGGKAAGQQANGTPTGSRAGAANGTPGAGFMSNEDIHAWCESVRKTARNKAVERAMDAEQLEAVLERIPTAQGSMTGARMRARRVSRHLRRIARAEKLIARAAAAAYAQFEKEFEADLRKVGKARQPQATKFQF